MESFIKAIKEGRCIELPVKKKDNVILILSRLIEAIPNLNAGKEFYKALKLREKSGNTGLGRGVACPHAVVDNNDNIHCAIGWSKQGIKYGASDGIKVHLVIMYYISKKKRTEYLSEIAGLARAIHKRQGIGSIAGADNLKQAQNLLLELANQATKISARHRVEKDFNFNAARNEILAPLPDYK